MITENIVEIEEIYTRSNDSFLVGERITQNVDWILYSNINEYGRQDGFFWIKKNAITRTEKQTGYLSKLKCFSEYWETEFNNVSNDVQFQFEDIEATLQYCLNQRKVVTIACIDREMIVTGMITSSFPLIIHEIDISTALYMENYIEIEMNDVMYIDYDGIENVLIEFAISRKD